MKITNYEYYKLRQNAYNMRQTVTNAAYQDNEHIRQLYIELLVEIDKLINVIELKESEEIRTQNQLILTLTDRILKKLNKKENREE